MCIDDSEVLSLTSGISKGTPRTCMPWRTTGLGCSMDSTGATSWTSVEVKLEDCDCRSRSLSQEKGVKHWETVEYHPYGKSFKTYWTGSSYPPPAGPKV